MPLGSFEGLLVTLLLLVPGGLGIELRRWIYPAKEPSPFAELLHALGASGAALISLEAGAAVYGALSNWRGGFGDALLMSLVEGHGIPRSGSVWATYGFGFLTLALVLPALAGRVRRLHFVRALFGRLALHDSAPDQLLDEIWRSIADGEAPWVVVETTDDRSIQGQIVWRTTAPYPTELLLIDVFDVTQPRRPITGGGGVLWLPRENIRRLWLLSLEAEARAYA